MLGIQSGSHDCIYPGMFGSYKVDKLEYGPKDFSVVCFHGTPKMHELPDTWVEEAWM